MSLPLDQVQALLHQEGLSGWFLYDFHQINPFFSQVLKMPPGAHVTRRLGYWIPAVGEPVKIVHRIEAERLDHLPGRRVMYSGWQEFDEALKLCKGRVAMEYSPDIPAISRVDAGIVDRLRRQGVEVVSSATLLQQFTSVLDEDQIASHLAAAKVVDSAANSAFNYIESHLTRGKEIFEGEVVRHILSCFEKADCITDHPPIVARGPNSASPHYAPEGDGDRIMPGDLVMIDLWCKEKKPQSIFADITRMGIFGNPTEEMQKAFRAVRRAQKAAIHFIEEAWARSVAVCGSDVDDVARSILIEEGFGDYILHRTGHNIHEELHGPGVHLDNLETHDTRVLLPFTCSSMEPAIYIPGKWGIRLEHDFLLFPDRILITGFPQEELIIKKS